MHVAVLNINTIYTYFKENLFIIKSSSFRILCHDEMHIHGPFSPHLVRMKPSPDHAIMNQMAYASLRLRGEGRLVWAVFSQMCFHDAQLEDE